MYNVNKPTQEDLPSSKQLIRSTVIAIIVAMILLVTVVMPAEYAIDPTGIGRVLGLTEMGEIKEQLAEEAAQDRALSAQSSATSETVKQPVAIEPAKVEQPNQAVEQAATKANEVDKLSEPKWREEISFALTPGQGTEYKLSMDKDAVATYSWVSVGGPINYDTHGDGGGNSISYEKGRGVDADEGTLTAAFTGNHGWFFRNRNGNDVTVTLRIGGDYKTLKRMM